MNGEKYGKRRQITYRISEVAEDRLKKASGLFDMKPAEYAKAVLYRDLGVFDEPLDRRKKSWQKRKKRQLQEDLFDEEQDEEELMTPGRHTTRLDE